MATLNNSSTQHPADGQHTPGGWSTGAVFFQNIKKESTNLKVLMFLYIKKISLPNALFFSGAAVTCAAEMSCVH